MTAYRVEAVVSDEGKIILDAEPFQPGQQVQVRVTSRESPKPNGQYPLRGKPVRYDRPFDGVAERDWKARQ